MLNFGWGGAGRLGGVDDVQAEALVALVAVAEGDGAGFPAASIVAAFQRAEGVEELVVRVGFPVGRFASAGDDDAGAVQRAVRTHGDGRGEMHDSCDRAQDARAVMDEADELAHIRPAPEIEHAAQGRVMVVLSPDLDEEDAAPEVIHDGLPPLRGPPFDADVRLAPGGDDPIRHVRADQRGDLRHPRLLHGMQMDVAPEQSRADADAELRGEVLREAVDGVEGRGVALIQQRVIAFDRLRFVVAQRGDVRIMQPQAVEGRAEVGEELAGVRAVQFAEGGGEERDVAEGIPAAEDELPFPLVRMRKADEREDRGCLGIPIHHGQSGCRGQSARGAIPGRRLQRPVQGRVIPNALDL